jgi:hypothetical protein
MNERIKELVVESGNGLMRDGKLYPHLGSRTTHDWEKFAELIVRECNKVNNQYVGWRIGDIDLGMVYKEHFGVEE